MLTDKLMEALACIQDNLQLNVTKLEPAYAMAGEASFSCRSSCASDCSGDCQGDCKSSCSGSCEDSCSGSRESACAYDCSSGDY